MVILDICFSLLIICSSKGSPCLLGEPAADQRPPLQFSFVSDWERLVHNRWPQRFKSDQETDFWWRNPGAEQARTGFWEALKLMELILHLYCSCVSVYSVTVRSCSIRTKRVGLVLLFCFLFCCFYVVYWESTVFSWFSWSTFSTHSEAGWNGWKETKQNSWSLAPTIPRNTAVYSTLSTENDWNMR